MKVDAPKGIPVGEVEPPPGSDETTIAILSEQFMCGECKCLVHKKTLKHGYDSLCSICYDKLKNQHATQINKSKSEKARQVIVANILGKNSRQINVPHICEVGDEIVRLFGGLPQFCADWKTQIDIAALQKPGSKTVLDSFKQIVNLIAISTDKRETAPDLAGVSDEEMMAELEALFTRNVELNVNSTAEVVAEEQIDFTDNPDIDDADVDVDDDDPAEDYDDVASVTDAVLEDFTP